MDESQSKDDRKSDRKLVYRYHALFNIEQTVGCSIEAIEKPAPLKFAPISAAEKIIQKMPERPKILDHPSLAAYCPSTDVVLMPTKYSFESSNAYYATLYHELAHSTAAPHRLNRTDAFSKDRAIGTYAFEELVAELTAAYLSQKTGIDNRFDQNASYLSGWLKPLQDKPSMFAKASSVAQRCADYICAESKCD